MAVVTPDGIVGKVTAVYPTASQVLLITDPDFAAGVVSPEEPRAWHPERQGTPLCKVDYVPFEEKVEPGEWFYTSGDDRIFPRGLPVGVVKSVRPGQPYQEITLDPSGMARGSPDDVLIVVEGVHQEIPDTPPANQQVYMAPPPPPLTPPAGTADTAATAAADGSTSPAAARPPLGTEADKERALYQKAADGSGIVLGGGATGEEGSGRPPDFTKLPVDPRSALRAVARRRRSRRPCARREPALPCRRRAPGRRI